MMYKSRLALNEIRRAAMRLKQSDRPVTLVELSRELSATRCLVKEYVTNIEGLANEIGFVSVKHIDNRASYYLNAVTQLERHGLLVTVKRVAILARAKPPAVHMWLKRTAQPDITAKFVSPKKMQEHMRVRLRGW